VTEVLTSTVFCWRPPWEPKGGELPGLWKTIHR